MKIFGWMQNKLNGRQKTNKIDSLIQVAAAADEKANKGTNKEVMAWPDDGLLTIGTLGISNLKGPPNSPRKSNWNVDHDDVVDDQTDVTDDDQVLKEFLSLQKGCSLPQENIIEILRSLREGNNESNGESSSSSNDVVSLRDDGQEHKRKSIRKRALHFLLKNTFLGGVKPLFSPPPILKDPLDLKLEKSRMEKILRAILHKQVHPQGSTQKASARKFIDTNRVTCNEYKDEALERDENEEGDEEEGIKWVKTDSEYIVLEI